MLIFSSSPFTCFCLRRFSCLFARCGHICPNDPHTYRCTYIYKHVHTTRASAHAQIGECLQNVLNFPQMYTTHTCLGQVTPMTESCRTNNQYQCQANFKQVSTSKTFILQLSSTYSSYPVYTHTYSCINVYMCTFIFVTHL